MKRQRIDKLMVPLILIVSILVPLLVVILMYLPQRYNFLGGAAFDFPFFHAALNFSTVIILLLAYFFIRTGEITWHRNLMILAFFLSTVFLVSYVISKMSNEPVPYGGDGWLKYVYYFILITHIILSAIIVPLVLFTLYRGLSGEYEKHRKIARYTFPVWMYVAITGVLVYVFMAPYY